MRDPGELWKLRVRSVDRARKAARRAEPEGLHDLRVALRRVGATADALGAKAVAREARRLVQSLSSERQIQVDRQLLARIGQLGYLSPDAATALAARWEKVSERGVRRIVRAADGRTVRVAAQGHGPAGPPQERRRRRAARARPASRPRRRSPTPSRARTTTRSTVTGSRVKKARYLAEDLAALGVRRFTSSIEREKALQEALGRWNDLRMFCRRLAESRDEAEERGAIMLAAELEHLLAALEPTIRRSGGRGRGVEGARVVPMVPEGGGETVGVAVTPPPPGAPT